MMGDIRPLVLAGKRVEEAQGPSGVCQGYRGQKKQVQHLMEKEPLGLFRFLEDLG